MFMHLKPLGSLEGLRQLSGQLSYYRYEKFPIGTFDMWR